MTLEQLRLAFPWQKPVLEAVVAWLKDAGRVAEQNGRLALAEHRPRVRDQDAPHLEAVERIFQEQLFHPPSAAELAEKTGLAPATVERLLRILQEHQRLAPVGEGLLFHQDAIEQARRLLVEHIRKEGRLESVDFKYLLETTRKFALPLLDYFDRTGLLRPGRQHAVSEDAAAVRAQKGSRVAQGGQSRFRRTKIGTVPSF